MADYLVTIPWQPGLQFFLGQWNGTNYAQLDIHAVPAVVRSSSIHPNSTDIAIGLNFGGFGPEPRLLMLKWDGVNMVEVANYTPPGATLGCIMNEFDPTGQYIGTYFSGTADILRIIGWNGVNLTSITTWTRPIGWILDCCWSPDGQYIGVLHTTWAAPPDVNKHCFTVLSFDGSILTPVATYAYPVPGNNVIGGTCAWNRGIGNPYIAISTQANPGLLYKCRLLKFTEENLSLLDTFILAGRPWDSDWNPLWEWRNDLVVAHQNAPFCLVLRQVEEQLVQIATFGNHDCYVSRWSPDGQDIAVGPATPGGPRLVFVGWDGLTLTAKEWIAAVTNYPWGLSFAMPSAIPPVLGAPHDLLCEQKTNPTDVQDPYPEFSAVHKYD